MKLLIAGSRSITDFDLEPFVPEDVDLIICGGAKGVDTLAERYADQKHISKLVMRPAYSGPENIRKKAPLKRNDEMIGLCDEALIIWDGVSRGTEYTINHMKKAGKSFSLRIVSGQK